MEPARHILESIAAATARERQLIAAYRGESTMTGVADQVEALLQAVRILEDAHIAYALVGGLAVGVHSGMPRATMDVDLAVQSSVDRTATIAAMTSGPFTLTGEFAHSINMRHVSGEPVQLAFDPAFDAMIVRADRIVVQQQSVRIVCKPDLIDMKRRASADPARRRSKALRDLADIEILQGDVPDPDEGW